MIINPADEGWLLAGGWVGGGRGSGVGEEEMESSGWLTAHLSCTHELEGTYMHPSARDERTTPYNPTPI